MSVHRFPVDAPATNPLLLTPGQQNAAHHLAIRYCAYQDAARRCAHMLPADRGWNSLSVWSGMLRDSQIETGITMVSNEYLKLTKMRANAMLDGNEAEAFALLTLMIQTRTAVL